MISASESRATWSESEVLPMIRTQKAVLALGLFALTCAAQEAPPPERTPAPAEAPPPVQSPPRASTEASDDVFIPTEELAADEEVTFPVDI
jgi:hypothetical protein